jgi:hypothetical protein
MSEYGRGRELGLVDGWNDALDAMIDRLGSAAESLDEMSNAKCSQPGKPLPGMTGDYDRLRGKRSGVLLALDYARGMKHQ